MIFGFRTPVPGTCCWCGESESSVVKVVHDDKDDTPICRNCIEELAEYGKKLGSNGKCVYCGAWINKRYPNHLYCSTSCKLKAYRKRIADNALDKAE